MITMNIFYTVVLICLSYHYVVCAPTETSMYDAIVEKCPYVKTLPKYKDQALFNSCKNWKVISEVNKLTSDNGGLIRCLLYFETFTSYCSSFENPDITIPKNVIQGYTMDMICNYAKTIPHKNLSTIFATEGNCQSICVDEINFVNSVCSASYYYANSTRPKSIPEEKPAGPQILSTDELDKGVPQHENKPPVAQIIAADNKKPIVNLTQVLAAPANSGAESHIDENVNNGNPADDEIAVPPKQEVGQDQKYPKIQELDAHNEAAPKIADGAQDLNSNVHHAEGIPAVAPVIGDKPEIHNKEVKEDTHSEVETTSNRNKNKPDTAPETDQNPQKSGDEDGEIQGEIPIDQQVPHLGDPEIDDGDDAEGLGSQEDMEASLNAARNEKNPKPDTEPVNYNTEMEGDSYFFTYFMILCIIFIAGYVCYHNKQKILALILEGRRGKRQHRGRRPNSANYHKLDSNLEEAINSSCKKNTNNVIY